MPFEPNRLTTLTAIAFDVDGVLTDGRLLWTASTGEEIKSFHFSDIMGISLLRRLGLKLALVSGEASPLVDRFAAKMHIHHVIKGTRDKAAALRDFATRFNLDLNQTAYFGDDINDLFAMDIAGLTACPSNAVTEVRDYVQSRNGFISSKPGGQGAVRELTDIMLTARNLRGRDVFLLRPPE
ncbi:MAG TPA: HAD hydrolase family protein [Acidobacteriaceae bacterium]|nr:HAD hydrolase family protein [Acidobacteriaceae bacterium]